MKKFLPLSILLAFGIFMTSCHDDLTEATEEISINEIDLENMSTEDFDRLEETLMINTEKSDKHYGVPRVARAPVHYWLDANKITGNARIFRLYDGVVAQLNHSSLPVGHAITMWFVAFNDPTQCETCPCTIDDAFNPAVKFDVIYAGGHEVKDRHERFSARIKAGAGNTESAIPFFQSIGFPLLDATGLLYPKGAEVHLVLRSHGPAISDILEEQIGSYEGGCVDLVDFLSPPEFPDAEYECGDFDYSIFAFGLRNRSPTRYNGH